MMLEVKTEGSPGLRRAGPLPVSPASLGLLTFVSAGLRPPFFPAPFLTSQPSHCFLQEDQPPWQRQFHHHTLGAPCSSALKTLKNCYNMVNMLFSRILGEKEKKELLFSIHFCDYLINICLLQLPRSFMRARTGLVCGCFHCVFTIVSLVSSIGLGKS